MPRKIQRASSPKPARKVRRRSSKVTARGEPTLLSFDGEHVLIPTISGPQQNEFRESEYMHVSDLIGKCIRRMALSQELGAPMPSEPLFPSQGVTFALGHAVEDFVIKRIKEKSPEYLWGRFECICGHFHKVGVFSRIRRANELCEYCNTSCTEYKELLLKDEEYMIQGHVDIVYYLHAAHYLSELKSMAASRWDNLESPVPEHVIQILLYWWMARRQGMDLYDKVSLLYVNKEWRMASPYKEFVLQPSQMMHRLEPYLEDAMTHAVHKRGGTLPPRIQCGDRKAPQAKKCHLAEECFAYEDSRS